MGCRSRARGACLPAVKTGDKFSRRPPRTNPTPPPPPDPTWVAAPEGMLPQKTPQIQGAVASASPQPWPMVSFADFQPAVNFYGVALKAREEKLGSRTAFKRKHRQAAW